MNSPTSVKRWYDEQPELSSTVQEFSKLSCVSQRIFAQLILSLAERFREHPEDREAVFEIKQDQLNGLLKSKTKRRWYDREPMVHQAFNALYLMDADDRAFLATRLADAISLVVRYDEFCREQDVPSVADDSIALIKACLEQGPDTGEEHLAFLTDAMSA